MEYKQLEETIFTYMDNVKQLVSPKTWENVLLDCSKNELFILLFVYRKKEANMSQLAEYIEVPLNTTTGIVDRMEKKKLLLRQRSKEDKRVVYVCMTEEGLSHVSDIIKEVLKYVQIVMDVLTPEEIASLFQLSDKIISILEETGKRQQGNQNFKQTEAKTIKRIQVE